MATTTPTAIPIMPIKMSNNIVPIAKAVKATIDPLQKSSMSIMSITPPITSITSNVKQLVLPRSFDVNNIQRWVQYGIVILIILYVSRNAVNRIISPLINKLFNMIGLVGDDRANFVSKNRCNPIMMPFVGILGSGNITTKDNLNECIQSMFSTFFGSYIKAFGDNQNYMFKIITGMTDDIRNIRKVIDNTRQSLINVLNDIYARMQNSFKRIHRLFTAFKRTIGDIMGIFEELFNVLKYIIFTLTSIWRGPIGKSARFFCFEENTPIQFANGYTKSISKIKIGDTLIDGGVVSALLKFDRNEERMFRLNNVIVSSNHPVYHMNNINNIDNKECIDNFIKLIPVYKHPESVEILQENSTHITQLYCLNTSNNLIRSNDTLFTDFDEFSISQLGFGYDTLINGEKIGDIYIDFYNNIDNIHENNKGIFGIVKMKKSLNTSLYIYENIVGTGEILLTEKNKIHKSGNDIFCKKMKECGTLISNKHMIEEHEYLYNIVSSDGLITVKNKKGRNIYFQDFYS